MNNQCCAMIGVAGERVALVDVTVSAMLRDMLVETSVVQTYRNDEQVNIEAVYTFSLPVDAVLLDFETAVGGRVLKGVVVAKTQASERYEDAVAAARLHPRRILGGEDDDAAGGTRRDAEAGG